MSGESQAKVCYPGPGARWTRGKKRGVTEANKDNGEQRKPQIAKGMMVRCLLLLQTPSNETPG